MEPPILFTTIVAISRLDVTLLNPTVYDPAIKFNEDVVNDVCPEVNDTLEPGIVPMMSTGSPTEAALVHEIKTFGV